MQCGVTCLAMVCRYYGKEYSLEALSHWCRPTSEGVSLHGISEAAGKTGMRTMYGRVSMEQLAHAPLPCILHWRQNHFTVLYRIGNKGRKYYVADPAKGLLTYSPEEFRTCWLSTASGGEECGVALILQTTPAFFEAQPRQSESPKTSFTFLAGYALWIMFFLRRRKVLDYELFEKQAASSSCTYQMITSMQEIKLQDCGQRRRWEWEDTQADVFGVQMKSLKLQQTQEAGGIFINEIKNIVITVLSATAVINGNMTLGMMLAVQYIIGQLNSPVEQLMSFIYSVQDVRISLERIGEVHNSHEEEETGHDLAEFRGGRHDIILSDVCFKYDIHALRNTVENISFTIPEGKVTAVVGASGSGKTTLIKLILGYYPVSEGNISVGGTDINDINLRWWRRQCGAVMQDGIIFSESIARNIAVDDGEIDKERLASAARIANIEDYILGLPLKYNTRIGRDGIGLSQGQKQRLLIARAIYKNPQFIFLDEATNSLDAGNEKVIVENLSEFYNGRTVVVVAHRLSTVRNADQIIVLDGGHVVETGNHTSLIAGKGIYYNLVKNQLELGN